MARKVTAESGSQTLAFDRFWEWVKTHPNCILRAGTPDAVIMDDDDFHWQFLVESADAFLVQVLLGKRLVGELAINPQEIAYVQAEVGEHPDEFVFDLVVEDERTHSTGFQVVLSHSFDDDDDAPSGRVTH